ncbi:MAG: Stk1 family PASTA domain-containing Ser/Thr kinase [Gaiellales bacterium]
MTADHRIGELFDGRYRLQRRIGSGGMADVYLAADESLDRRVAIKILAERYTRDEGFIERFRREARSAAGLTHPNIVAIYDRGEAGGEYYIAMEYVDGETLKDEINAHAPLPESEAIGYAQQALAGLEYAHRGGIVHRDVKPHNMLIGSDGVLKMTDFGIARAQNTTDMTEVGSIVGTAQYLSPEQARGQTVGPQSDIYSMGVVLYEMLTGELPFSGGSAVEIAMKQASEQPEPPSRKIRLISRPLELVVLRALAKDPALRFQSAREMADELERVRRGLAVSQSTQQATMVMAAPTRVMPAAAATPPPEEPVQPKRSALPWILVVILLIAAAGVGYLIYQQLQSDQVQVPDVTGLTAKQAKQRLVGEGFEVRQQQRNSSFENKGKVIDTNPAPGNHADQGSTVTIYVGTGPKSVPLPNLKGKTLDEALQTITDLHLPTPKTVPTTSTQPTNIVVRTTPPAGPVAPDQVVTIYYSSGQVNVPNVVGLDYTSAATKLANAKLVPARVDQSSDTVPAGQVISTNPAPGKPAVQGSTVTVVVSSGPAPPQPVSVPPVTGMTQADAQQALADADLKNTISKCLATTGTPDGQVVSADPAPGTSVQPKSTVTLFVADATQTTPCP